MLLKYSNSIGFTYIEVIVSLLVAGIIGFGIFSINDFLLNNDTKNRKDATLVNFSEYIYDIVDSTPIPDDFTVALGQKFYVMHLTDNMGENDDIFVYTNNPSFKTKDLGFFNTSASHAQDYSQEIVFIGTGALTDNYGTQNTVYHFAIHTTYAGKENTLYITK